MTAITFPATPTVGQKHTVGKRAWVWDGAKWNLATAPAAPVLPVGATGTVPSYPTAAALPAAGPAAGDPTHAFIVAEGNIYEWKGGKWAILGLTGIGGWAQLQNGPSAQYTDAAGVKWNLWQIMSTMDLTFTREGIIDTVIIGGGGSGRVIGNSNGGNGGGSSGSVNHGLMKVAVGTQHIVIGGAGVKGAPQGGKTTAFGIAVNGGGDAAYGGGNGMGSTGTFSGTHSSITGTDVEYAKGGVCGVGGDLTHDTNGPGGGAQGAKAGVNFGDGGGSGMPGKAGVVFIRIAA